MKKVNIAKCLVMSALAMGMTVSVTPSQGYNVLADDVVVTAKSSNSNTPGGIANLGGGGASITIKGNDGQTLVGKKFNIYKLFNAENSEGMESINYTFNPEYEAALKKVVGKKINKDESKVTEYEVIDYIQTLNTNKVEGAQADQTLEGRYSDFRYFVEELRSTIVSMNLAPSVVTVTDVDKFGNVEIQGLDYGYYILDEVTANQGDYSSSSLCMVNTANPDAEIQIKSDYPSVEKKILEDDEKETIGLYKDGWNDIADYEIGQTVPYKYTTHVPDMNGYHKYFFAFHDKMDEALTFDKDSVKITITDSKKSYTLKSSEYTILENAGEDTFRIEIADLKAIVDKQFPEGLDNNGHNVYGQQVVVTYNATLNDKAADDTGRPGFENAVRLEFSNDPDSTGEGKTGFTPWDTVVCFTYKINGLKLNNHDKELKGAKFRLYSDEACTQEVYVKKTENGYNVINRDSVGGDDHTGGSVPIEATEMVSDENGVFTIFGLDGGTYWLKETDAPDGYRPILDPIEINVTPTFVENRDVYVAGDGATDKALVSLDATAHIKQFLEGAYDEDDLTLETNVDEGSANITVVNQVGTKLPITGSNATIIMLAAGAIMMTGAIVASRRKKVQE